MFRIQSSSLYNKLYKPCNDQDNKLNLPFSSDVLNKNPKLKNLLLLSQNYSEKQKVSYNKGAFCNINKKIEHKDNNSNQNKKLLDTQKLQESKELESNNYISTIEVEVFDEISLAIDKISKQRKYKSYNLYDSSE